MRAEVRRILACPKCKSRLGFTETRALCLNGTCKKSFAVKEGVPVMVADEGAFFRRDRDLRWDNAAWVHTARRLYRKLSSSHTFKSRKSRGMIPRLLKNLSADHVAVNVGSGRTAYSIRVVNVDIFPYDNVDIVGDACELPVADDSVDLVISQAALEHIQDPRASIAEMKRILKRDGKVYCEVPFMQPFHADPNDYYRFTLTGIEEAFREFTILEKGVVVGPSSAFSLILRTYVALLFSFGNTLVFHFLGLLLGWITLPIKYLDVFLEKNSLAYRMASGIYVLGVKK